MSEVIQTDKHNKELRKISRERQAVPLVLDFMAYTPNAHHEIWTDCSSSLLLQTSLQSSPTDRRFVPSHSFPQITRTQWPLLRLLHLLCSIRYSWLVAHWSTTSLISSETIPWVHYLLLAHSFSSFLRLFFHTCSILTNGPYCTSSTLHPILCPTQRQNMVEHSLLPTASFLNTGTDFQLYIRCCHRGLFVWHCKPNVSTSESVAPGLPLCTQTCSHQNFSSNALQSSI